MTFAKQNHSAAVILLAILIGCSSGTPFISAGSKLGPLSATTEEQPKSESIPVDPPQASEPETGSGDTVAEPVSVGGAYFVCEINLNAQTAPGMSAVGCNVTKDNKVLAFAKDYDSKLDLNTAGSPVTDVTIADHTEAPAPYQWEFVIASSRLVGSEAIVTLTSKRDPSLVAMFKAPLPAFPGMDIRTRLGFNFDDFGIGTTPADKDFNDVVICMNGEFRLSLEEKLLVSQIDQDATLQYRKNAACSQQLQVTYSNPGNNTFTIFVDSVDAVQQEKVLSLKKGAEVQVTFKVGAPCKETSVSLFNNANVKLRAEACGMMPSSP